MHADIPLAAAMWPGAGGGRGGGPWQSPQDSRDGALPSSLTPAARRDGDALWSQHGGGPASAGAQLALGWGSGWGAWGEPQTPSLPVLGVATGVGSSTTADSAPTMRLLPVPCNQPLPARAPALPTAAPPQWSRFANAFPPSPRGEGAGIRDMYRKDPGETRRQLALDLLGSQEDEENWASPSLLPDAAGASSENPGGRVAATPALPPSEERVDPEAACLHASKTAHLVDAPACDGEEANRARKRQRLSEILLGTTDGARAGGCTREPLGQLRERKCKGREFLTTDRRDAQARPRGTPGYDGRTLLVPQQYMSELTPTMQQFWRVKSSHADCVVFFNSSSANSTNSSTRIRTSVRASAGSSNARGKNLASPSAPSLSTPCAWLPRAIVWRSSSRCGRRMPQPRPPWSAGSWPF